MGRKHGAGEIEKREFEGGASAFAVKDKGIELNEYINQRRLD